MLPWLEATALATWVRESPSILAYPTVLTLHTAGLGVVVGAAVVVDLRLLGYARRIRVATLEPLFTVMACAFALNLVTGVLLFIADATTKAKQPVFYVKLGMILIALWCTFATRRIIRDNSEDTAVDTVPAHGARLSMASLLLWTGAIVAGRLMAYL